MLNILMLMPRWIMFPRGFKIIAVLEKRAYLPFQLISMFEFGELAKTGREY